MVNDEIVREIAGEDCPWLAYRVRRLVSTGAAFCDFARKNVAKIRRKLDEAKESEDKGDVLAELEYAACILADQRFAVEYEPYGCGKGRKPDFLVLGAGLQDFHLEVKCIREAAAMVTLQREEPAGGERGFWEIPYTQKESHKFGDHLLDSIGQMRPGKGNVLGINIESSTHDPVDLILALHQLGGQVIARDDEFFRRKGFAGAKDFYESLSLLSGVVVKSMWASVNGERAGNLVWLNSRAEVRLEPGVVAHLRSM